MKLGLSRIGAGSIPARSRVYISSVAVKCVFPAGKHTFPVGKRAFLGGERRMFFPVCGVQEAYCTSTKSVDSAVNSGWLSFLRTMKARTIMKSVTTSAK